MQPITRFYQQCEPLESLRPSDERWVDFDEVRGEENVVQTYARSLRRTTSGRPDFKLFSGHRGVGKTSELYRLQALLEKREEDSKGFVVLYCDVTEQLDLNDLDFPDLLVFLAAQLQDQLPKRLDEFIATNTYLNRVWEDLRSLLTTRVAVTDITVDSGFASLTTEFRNQPNARRELRQAVERHNTSLLTAVNDLLTDADVAARQQGHDGIILIIDGLDKLVYRELTNGSSTHERLFIDRSEQLSDLNVHTIYTVPISLIYSPGFSQLEQAIGEHNAPVSMIRLRTTRTEDVNEDSPGMIKLREMIERRCHSADLELTEVFDDVSTLNYLCEMSGGHPRHLLMFLQSACNELDDLPLNLSAAKRAVRKYANSLKREVPDAAWQALRKFSEPQSVIPKDELHQSMLLLAFVFEYLNGDIWYEVNPVIKTIDRFNG